MDLTPSRRASARALVIALALMAALTACATALPKPLPPASSAYTPRAEVFWVTIAVNGRRAGFGRGEYTRGEGAPYQYQNLILFTHGGYRHAQRDWWEFGGDLRPANFFQKIISWKGGQSVTNTIDGVFHYDTGKLKVEYNEFNTHENVDVPIPPSPLARFTQNLVLARQKLSAGRSFRFTVYDSKHRRFAVQTFKVISFDSPQRAWKIEQTSEENPGAVSTSWFQSASAAHPNGWVVRSVTPGADHATIEMRAVTRDEAIKGYEKEATSLGI